MSAAFHGQQQVVLAREVHRGADVGDAGRLHDQRGMLVDRFVQHPPGLVVARVARQEQRATQARLQLLDGRLLDDGRAAAPGHGRNAAGGLGCRLIHREHAAVGQRTGDCRGHGCLEEVPSVHFVSPSGLFSFRKAERSSSTAA